MKNSILEKLCKWPLNLVGILSNLKSLIIKIYEKECTSKVNTRNDLNKSFKKITLKKNSKLTFNNDQHMLIF